MTILGKEIDTLYDVASKLSCTISTLKHEIEMLKLNADIKQSTIEHLESLLHSDSSQHDEDPEEANRGMDIEEDNWPGHSTIPF